MSQCIFCELIASNDRSIYYEDPANLFVAMWTSLPVFPGHTLVIPKRHSAHFRDMNKQEMSRIVFAVSEVKTKIEHTNLKNVYKNLEVISDESKQRINQVLATLEQQNYQPPQAFNDGINDGPQAGQTIPHMHWHILPRWDSSAGDIINQFKSKNL